jgi:hypothetical protein
MLLTEPSNETRHPTGRLGLDRGAMHVVPCRASSSGKEDLWPKRSHFSLCSPSCCRHERCRFIFRIFLSTFESSPSCNPALDDHDHCPSISRLPFLIRRLNLQVSTDFTRPRSIALELSAAAGWAQPHRIPHSFYPLAFWTIGTFGKYTLTHQTATPRHPSSCLSSRYPAFLIEQ